MWRSKEKALIGWQAWIRALVPNFGKQRNVVNTNSNGAKKQPKAVRLTPQQSQLLAYFSGMKKSVQLTMIDIAEELAEAFPASATTAAGGAA